MEVRRRTALLSEVMDTRGNNFPTRARERISLAPVSIISYVTRPSHTVGIWGGLDCVE